ncbi:MAG: hypothetical protein HY077_04160 [Elusimicrobia bacterium]|nr:hypothetical protein [Elusimicrobiota bacterium]
MNKIIMFLAAAAVAASGRAQEPSDGFIMDPPPGPVTTQTPSALSQLRGLIPPGLPEGIPLVRVQAAPVDAEPTAAEIKVRARMEKAGRFVFGPAGFSRTTPQSAIDFDFLMASKAPKKLFVTLLERGTNEAKLYALVGLRHADPAKFDDYAKALKAANPSVMRTIGHMTFRKKASEVIAEIEKGQYDEYVPSAQRLVPFETVGFSIGDGFRGYSAVLTVKADGQAELETHSSHPSPVEKTVKGKVTKDELKSLAAAVKAADMKTVPESVEPSPDGPQDMPSVKLTAQIDGKTYSVSFSDYDLSRNVKLEKRLRPLVDALEAIENVLSKN